MPCQKVSFKLKEAMANEVPDTGQCAGTSKVIPFSTLVTLRTFIYKTGSFRKLSITFDLMQFGESTCPANDITNFVDFD